MKIKPYYILLVFALLTLTLIPGCSGGNTAGSDFTKILDMVPYSMFEQYDIFYGDLNGAKAFYGVTEFGNMEQYIQAEQQQKNLFSKAWAEIAAVFPSWSLQADITKGGLAAMTGFDPFFFDRAILIGNTPPHMSFITQGKFDVELIAVKLTDQGYTKTSYGKTSYFSKGDDLHIDPSTPLGKIVLSGLNRIAVFDKTLVMSPVTADVTGTLDTMDGKTPSIYDNEICRALADNLGNPLRAVFTTPERLVSSVPLKTPGASSEQAQPAPDGSGLPIKMSNAIFDYPVPEDWGQLQGCEMAALGYRVDGANSYFDIALYYDDKGAAEADGKEIIKRMNSYNLTLLQKPGGIPFVDQFQPGEPQVIQSEKGVILKISCLISPGTLNGATILMGGNGMPVRDLLFLSPEPEQYTGE